MIFNDHIVGLLGAAVHAPVGQPAVVDVPAELIRMQPEMQHMEAGPAHATLWIRDCTERESIQYTHVSENRSRFASLAVLYGWVGANDHQFIYGVNSPHLVYSIDHGHFFPGGPNWTTGTLSGAPAPIPDQTLHGACGFTSAELFDAVLKLAGVTDREIATVLVAPPPEWGPVATDERAAVAAYLCERRDCLVAASGGCKGSGHA